MPSLHFSYALSVFSRNFGLAVVIIGSLFNLGARICKSSIPERWDLVKQLACPNLFQNLCCHNRSVALKLQVVSHMASVWFAVCICFVLYFGVIC